MKRITVPFVALVLSAAVCLPVRKAQADFIFSPTANATVDGNNSSAFPFSAVTRYQQVYRASDFGLSPVLISQIAFRPDTVNGNPFSTTITNIQIDLARTLNQPDALSSTFANNIISGSAQTVRSGSLPLSSSDIPNATNTAREFDIIIDFSNNPYSYDPTTGNLLLDVRKFSGEGTTSFDAALVTGDSVSRVFSNGNANATTGEFASSGGLVTRFTTTSAVSTPEPSTYAMMFVGLGMLVVAQRKKKKAKA